MNSVPSWRAGQTVIASTASASTITSVLACITPLITGR
jgi:hypothetical protein